jgi:hypothetical protein
LVALAVALVATVAADGYVDGEVPGAGVCGGVQGTGAVPLNTGSLCWFEVEQVQDFFHRDFSAEFVEVDSWHGLLSLCGGFDG